MYVFEVVLAQAKPAAGTTPSSFAFGGMPPTGDGKAAGGLPSPASGAHGGLTPQQRLHARARQEREVFAG